MAGHSDNDLALPEFTSPPKVAIVIAPYYTAIATAQLKAVRAVLERVEAEVEVIEVPGSLEIGPAIAMADAAGAFDGFVALGCVIRGATSHYDVVVSESARAITYLALEGIAVGNGIITVENIAQAEERADGGRLNTGGGAAEAALHLIGLRQRFEDAV